MQDEIFGPVVAISKFKTAEEAVEKAHLTKYGLGAAVFTKDMSRAIKISNSLKAGTVWGLKLMLKELMKNHMVLSLRKMQLSMQQKLDLNDPYFYQKK
ncbi:14674_t:CDS:2 [Entrophospora sp. SA101]|nr:14674_t:CDS:2 [Entrophospora sp. SA101]